MLMVRLSDVSSDISNRTSSQKCQLKETTT